MFSVHFENVTSPQQLLDKGLFLLHARVVSLFEKFPSQHYVCGMDNLYTSSNIALYAINCKSKLYIHCVTRKSGRKISKCIKQTAHKINDNIIRHRGTLKLKKLVGEPTMKDMVEISLYDVKPFYFMKNAWTDIRWRQKRREVWSSSLQRMIKIPYYRLNVIDIYNHNMNNVDISDQLRVVYRRDHWMRKRKWW